MTFLVTRGVNNEKDWRMNEEFSTGKAIQGDSRWQMSGMK